MVSVHAQTLVPVKDQRKRFRVVVVVAHVGRDVDTRLHGAAALSVLAQIEWLVERGLVRSQDEPRDTPVTLASRLAAT